MPEIGDVVACSKSKTGKVKVWGLDPSPPHPSGIGNWNVLCSDYYEENEKEFVGNIRKFTSAEWEKVTGESSIKQQSS